MLHLTLRDCIAASRVAVAALGRIGHAWQGGQDQDQVGRSHPAKAGDAVRHGAVICRHCDPSQRYPPGWTSTVQPQTLDGFRAETGGASQIPLLAPSNSSRSMTI